MVRGMTRALGVLAISLSVVGCDRDVRNASGDISGLSQAATSPDAGACIAPPPGIVAWWTGEGDAKDIVGHDDGVIEGGVTFPSGKVGRGFRFDGAKGTLVRASSQGFPSGASPRTVEFWTRLEPDSNADTVDMAGFGYGPASQGQVYYVFPEVDKYDGRLTFSGGGLAFDLLTQADFRDGQWHHVAVAYDGAIVTIYADGAQVSSGSFQLDTGTTGGACIGGSCIGDAIQSLTGDIDEVTLYNRALSPGEVQGIYNAGDAGKCTLCSASCAGAPMLPGQACCKNGPEAAYDPSQKCCTSKGLQTKYPIKDLNACPSRAPHLGAPRGVDGCSTIIPQFFLTLVGQKQIANDLAYWSGVFQAACNRHDACYDDCARTKDDCDDELLFNSYITCSATFGKHGGDEAQCRHAARLFHKVVNQAGGTFWSSAQKRVCDCCSGDMPCH
jgi:hypothetical protein